MLAFFKLWSLVWMFVACKFAPTICVTWLREIHNSWFRVPDQTRTTHTRSATRHELWPGWTCFPRTARCTRICRREWHRTAPHCQPPSKRDLQAEMTSRFSNLINQSERWREGELHIRDETMAEVQHFSESCADICRHLDYRSLCLQANSFIWNQDRVVTLQWREKKLRIKKSKI